jgi:TetR/AcrR family transcriptional repressor of nem operon
VEIKKGSFYHHFESKTQLALEALETQWSQMRPTLDELFSPLVSPLERIRRFFKYGIELQVVMHTKVGFVCGCPLVSLGCEISSQEPELRSKVAEILDYKLRYLESAIREARTLGHIEVRDPHQTAQIISDYAEGVLTRARITNDLNPVLQLETSVFAILNPVPHEQAVNRLTQT